MFDHITSSYSGEDATLEILIIISVSFAFGFLFRWVIGKVLLSRLNNEIARIRMVESELKMAEKVLKKKLDYMEGLEREYQNEMEANESPDSEDAIMKILRSSV